MITADIRQSTDYSPFGVTLEGRNLTLAGAEKMRYGYQGSEKDDEVKGDGNSYSTFFRQLDPRLGRWLSLDPKFDASMSPYNSMDNNPIWHNDKMGDKVVKDKDDDVSNRDFRKMKRYIKQLIKHSETFRNIQKHSE